MAKTATKKQEDRFEHLQELCKRINNSEYGGENHDALTFFGKGGSDVPKSERFSTGAVGLDEALGGGWPMGRICEIYGPESSGKSTLTLHAIAEFQKKFPDDDVALIDSEASFDPEYARILGVNLDTILINQPDSGEQALNVAEMLIENGVKMIVVDSVAAMTTKAELDGAIGDATVASQARLMSGGLKRLIGKVSKSKAFILFTNQVRDKIGVTWGEKTTQPGGRALRFYASCRVALAAIGKEKEGDVIVSTKVKATVKKNKTAPPFREALFHITFGHGVDSAMGLFESALEKKLIKRKGAWYEMLGERYQGKNGALEAIRSDEKVRDQLQDLVMGKGQQEPPEGDVEEAEGDDEASDTGISFEDE